MALTSTLQTESVPNCTMSPSWRARKSPAEGLERHARAVQCADVLRGTLPGSQRSIETYNQALDKTFVAWAKAQGEVTPPPRSRPPPTLCHHVCTVELGAVAAAGISQLPAPVLPGQHRMALGDAGVLNMELAGAGAAHLHRQCVPGRVESLVWWLCVRQHHVRTGGARSVQDVQHPPL